MDNTINNVIPWLMVATFVGLVAMFVSAFFTQSQNQGSVVTGKHFWLSMKNWVGSAHKWVKFARVVFLVTVLLSLAILVVIAVLMVIQIFLSHLNWWTGSLNVVFVLLAIFESIMLLSYHKKARKDYFLLIYAWFLMISILLSAAASCVYFDEESGLDSADALIAGGLILLTAVIASVNLLLYIFDLYKDVSVECLLWFKRTMIFEVITVVFVFSVILTPILKNYADYFTVFDVFFSIATWEYMKHLWDERIMPANQ